MNNDMIIKEYKEYKEYQDKIGSRLELYKLVSQKFEISRALYPGCHIDLSPSLVIPNVVYVDNYKGTIKFFKHINQIKAFLNEHKEYKEECEISFFGQDYTYELAVEPVDLIISQYAGFVGQATKEYLKVGGILLCNDSHGDATLAKFDEDFRFIGTIDGNYEINYSSLDDYFMMPKGKPVDLVVVKSKMKGPKYSKSAENYLFQKYK